MGFQVAVRQLLVFLLLLLYPCCILVLCHDQKFRYHVVTVGSLPLVTLFVFWYIVLFMGMGGGEAIEQVVVIVHKINNTVVTVVAT